MSHDTCLFISKINLNWIRCLDKLIYAAVLLDNILTTHMLLLSNSMYFLVHYPTAWGPAEKARPKVFCTKMRELPLNYMQIIKYMLGL